MSRAGTRGKVTTGVGMPLAPVVTAGLGVAEAPADDGDELPGEEVDEVADEGLGVPVPTPPVESVAVAVGVGDGARSSSAPTIPAGMRPAAGVDPGAARASASL